MKTNILITGLPRSGKTTLLNKLIANIPNKMGFVTNEILGETERLGFEIETHSGHKKTFAHVDFKTDIKVSRYFVDIKKLEEILPEVSDFGNDVFLYLDEIGQMELFSKQFEKLVLKYLDSRNTCLATLSCVFESDFIKQIRERGDVILIELSPESREDDEIIASQLLREIEKSKKYD